MKASLSWIASAAASSVACSMAIACAGPSHSERPVQLTSSSAPADTAERADATELAMNATGCWLGGIWGDALGEDAATRPAKLEGRCDAVLSAIGQTHARGYAPLRAAEPASVVAIEQVIDAGAGRALVPFVHAVADASREQLRARRIADQVKRDAAEGSSAYDDDKRRAAVTLDETTALRALVRFKGPHAVEAHAVALLLATDRMEIARGLPKHLKIVATRGTVQELFGLEAPRVPEDPSARSAPGAWLSFLEDVAAKGGHPTRPIRPNGENRADMENYESLVWNAALQSFADRMRPLVSQLPVEGTLVRVVRGTVARLDDQWSTARSLASARGLWP